MSGRGTGPSAGERAYAHIREAILGGELAVGTMLSENELATSLAMSRTPVRAALVRLQEEGWVTIYAQRGALVNGLSAREVQQSAEVRHALETAGVRRSAAPARQESESRQRENLDEQERALEAGDVPAFARLALRFHRTFVALADNDLMLAMYDRLQDRQLLSINQSAGRIVGEPQQVLAEHRGLLDAALAGDSARFADLLERHQARSHGFEGGSPAAAY
ncbi:GntR family transcriptional regulator [Nocardioides sp. BYT-33-1]|uniref:GntR family transcriptional regulator n=1 Tax=Nocardioides sp. BYT-33-1 TaxID=3416952 RepID=UPI003F53D0ED